MKNIFLAFLLCVVLVGCEDNSMPDKTKAYTQTKRLLEANLKNIANEMDFPFMDYFADYLNDSTFLIVSYFDYKNDYGVKKRFHYRARIKYKGGPWVKDCNWELMYVEEYKR